MQANQDQPATTTEQCPVCGDQPLFPLIAIAPWSVLACRECGHGVVEPFPGRQELAALYNGAYFAARYHKPLHRNDPAFARRIRQEAHRVRFVRRFCRQGTLLDVGCGSGYFLFAAQKAGLEAVGTDVTEANRHFIESALGGKLLVGDLEQLPLPAGSLDVITMWHTLEHHPDPAASVRQCLPWLKKDGVLLVEVPNHDSIDARADGIAWPDWDLPFHLHHFSAKSLRRLLEDAGLRVVAEKTYHSRHVRERLARTILLRPLARLIATWYKGGSILLACRRR